VASSDDRLSVKGSIRQALQAQHALSVRGGAIISNFGVMAVSTGLADGISPGGSQGRLLTFGTIGSWRLHPPAGTRWLAVCGVRLGWLRSEEAKAKHSTAQRSTSGRSEREAGLPRARMHTHTHQRSVGSRTRSLEVASSTLVKLDKPQVPSFSTCELP
jgi:hypothetical protein